jgi:hypothetical protein
MSNTTDLSVRERLQRAITRPLSAEWPTELHRDALAELERYEAHADTLILMQETALKSQQLCREVLAYVSEFAEDQVGRANAFAVGLRDLQKKFA